MHNEYVKRLLALMADISTALVEKPCSDFPEYRQLAGKWQGLKMALELLEEVEKEDDERRNRF